MVDSQQGALEFQEGILRNLDRGQEADSQLVLERPPEHEFPKITQQGRGENKRRIRLTGLGKRPPGEGPDHGSLPKLARAKPVTGLRRPEHPAAHHRGHHLEERVETNLHHGLRHTRDPAGVPGGGAVADLEHATGQDGIEPDQFHQRPGIGIPLLPEHGQEIEKDARGRRKFLRPVDEVVTRVLGVAHAPTHRGLRRHTPANPTHPPDSPSCRNGRS
jgi:hypothetical protein